LGDLLESLCLEELSTAGAARLEELVSSNPDCCRQYVVFMQIHALVERFGGKWQSEASGEGAVEALPPPAFLPDTDAPIPDSASRPIPSSYKLPLAHSTLGGWAFSYAVATVFVCLLILGFWAYKLPSDRGSLITTNENSPGLTDPGESPHARPALVFVGRITGIAAAKWSDDPDYLPPIGVNVRLGRQYKLKSGLMEITYDSGAKVILEGPCDYTAESTAGGYLALGKLVARIGERGEGRGKSDNSRRLTASGNNTEMAQTPEAVSLRLLSKSPNAPSPLSPPPSPLFAVRTPTAIVTDLGTEFGVEVDESGDTTSHVFQGTVVVQAGMRGFGDTGIGDSDKRPTTAVVGGESDQTVALTAGQSICVGRVRETHQEPVAGALVRFTHPTSPPQFARRIYGPPKSLDLLDIVAGGDGRGKRRERGIDPATGYQDSVFLLDRRTAQQSYTPVKWNRFVDGVFMPVHGDAPPGTQLDSAGHAYDGFDIFKYKYAPLRRTVGSIWARAAEINDINMSQDRWCWVYSMGQGERFQPERKGLLCLRPNAGITFDLEALRTAHEGARPARFRAIAGVADASEIMADKDPQGKADLWVFVDGRLKQQRLQLQPQDGVAEINVELGTVDRFLTLVSTDSNDGSTFDWVVWGDPTLDMAETDKEGKSD